MTPRQQAYEFFVHQGWTPQQSAGIVANLEAESGLRPDAVGDGGQAYGIAQWHPDRQANFAGLMGKAIQGSALEDQLYFVHAELQGSEKRAGQALAACTTAAEAGACVSKLYERPADREGEAVKRGIRAEQILASQIDLGAAIVPPGISTPSAPAEVSPQPQESPVFALLSTLLPSILPLLAPKAQAAITKATGAPPDVSGQFLTDLFGKIAQVTGVAQAGQPLTQAQAIQAAGAIQTAPPAAINEVETHALDYLDKLGPLFDKLAAADAAENAAAIARMNAASDRSARDRWDMTPWLVWIAGGTSTVLVLSLLGALIYQATTGEKTIDVGLVGLAGPLLAIAMNVWREIFSYRFDGNPASNTAAAINQQIAAVKPR